MRISACRLRLTFSLVLVSSLLAAMTSFAPSASADAGSVQFAKTANSSFDSFTSSASPSVHAWINAHMWRMTVYAPYFDNKTSWYARGWSYRDAYAIYKGSDTASNHPDWILKDARGNRLYIPYACSGGTCPQYAGDIANPAYRAAWIANVIADRGKGYKGVFVDDVNMNFNVGNGSGDNVAPIDSNTGRPMTWTAWRNYMATFMEELRAAVPGYEIVHNSVWYAGDGRTSDPYVRRQIAAADYIDVERGIADSGLTGGNGDWSLNALLSYIDYLHSQGKGAILDASGVSSDAEREYELAGYFLISTGRDGVATAEQTPDNWWSGYDTSLGAAHDARTTWNGLLRRDFDRGMVLLNGPGAATRTVSLPGTYRDTAGHLVTSVTLGPKSGAVLTLVAAAAGASAPSPPVPTSTTVQAAPAAPIAPTSTPASAKRAVPARSPGHVARARAASRRPATSHHVSRPRVRRVWLRGRVRYQRTGRVSLTVSKLVRVRCHRHGHRAMCLRWKRLRPLKVRVHRSGRYARVAHLSRGTYRVSARYLGTREARSSRSPLRRFHIR